MQQSFGKTPETTQEEIKESKENSTIQGNKCSFSYFQMIDSSERKTNSCLGRRMGGD